MSQDTPKCKICGSPAEKSGTKRKDGTPYYGKKCSSCRKANPGKETLEERFFQKFEKTAGCWEWCGGIDAKGYGVIGNRASRNLLAHRVSYEIHNGKIPEGMFVCHSCDNRKCVNPAHLFLGSHSDNMADMASKGRAVRGEKHPRAVLSEIDVISIRKLHMEGFSLKSLARRYSVAPNTVRNAVNRISWKHIE